MISGFKIILDVRLASPFLLIKMAGSSMIMVELTKEIDRFFTVLQTCFQANLNG